LAGVLRPGDTVLLGGDLGAGKTTFTQGLAAALEVTEPVTSPTFVLVHSYRTGAGWDLLHADVWRLGQLQEVIDLALPELLEDGAAVVVEWGERAAPALSADCLHVAIDFDGAGPPSAGTVPAQAASAAAAPEAAAPADARDAAAGERRLVFTSRGASWDGRMADLAAVMARASSTA
jgi:tRNA threonylcarbamoyladenosine biosynthesis protein TsaE